MWTPALFLKSHITQGATMHRYLTPGLGMEFSYNRWVVFQYKAALTKHSTNCLGAVLFSEISVWLFLCYCIIVFRYVNTSIVTVIMLFWSLPLNNYLLVTSLFTSKIGIVLNRAKWSVQKKFCIILPFKNLLLHLEGIEGRKDLSFTVVH